MDSIKNLGGIIRKRRSDLKITQQELGEQTGLSLFRVGQIERGEDNVEWSEITAIGQALGLNKVKAWLILGKEVDNG